MNHTHIIEKLEGAKINQAPYQIQVPCFLTEQKNQEATLREIGEKLQNLNGGPIERFLSRNPVYGVLMKKDVLEKTANGYRLRGKFTKAQLKQIQKVCERRSQE
jgi:hypothetical protein